MPPPSMQPSHGQPGMHARYMNMSPGFHAPYEESHQHHGAYYDRNMPAGGQQFYGGPRGGGGPKGGNRSGGRNYQRGRNQGNNGNGGNANPAGAERPKESPGNKDHSRKFSGEARFPDKSYQQAQFGGPKHKPHANKQSPFNKSNQPQQSYNKQHSGNNFKGSEQQGGQQGFNKSFSKGQGGGQGGQGPYPPNTHTGHQHQFMPGYYQQYPHMPGYPYYPPGPQMPPFSPYRYPQGQGYHPSQNFPGGYATNGSPSSFEDQDAYNKHHMAYAGQGGDASAPGTAPQIPADSSYEWSGQDGLNGGGQELPASHSPGGSSTKSSPGAKGEPPAGTYGHQQHHGAGPSHSTVPHAQQGQFNGPQQQFPYPQQPHLVRFFCLYIYIVISACLNAYSWQAHTPLASHSHFRYLHLRKQARLFIERERERAFPHSKKWAKPCMITISSRNFCGRS